MDAEDVAPLVPPVKEDRSSIPVMWVLKAVSCLMALDFMIVFLTVQQYWLSADGNPDLYGLVFSSYSIAQFLFILLVANYLDKNPMKKMLIVTVFVNMIGNIIYMCGASFGPGTTAQGFIFAGRFIAGIGAANVVVGPYYIVTHTRDVAQRAGRIAVYNLYGFIGRVAGPMLAFVILEYEPIINKPHFVMNQFTWPPLITSIDCVLVIIMICVLLTHGRDPRPPPSHGKVLRGGSGLKMDLAFIYLTHMLVLCVFWAWYANIITIAGVQFNFAQRYGPSMYWHAYLPVMVGFIVGTYTFKGLMKLKVNAVYTLIFAMMLMILGFIIMLDLHFVTRAFGKSDEARFWIGSILLTIGFNMESAAIPAIYSSIVESTGNEHIMAKMLGVLTLFTCAGRSLGPLWTPAFLKVDEQDTVDDTSSCCTFIDGVVSGPDKNNTCCKLDGVNTLFSILCVGTAVAAVAFLWLLRIQRKYSRSRELASLVN